MVSYAKRRQGGDMLNLTRPKMHPTDLQTHDRFWKWGNHHHHDHDHDHHHHHHHHHHPLFLDTVPFQAICECWNSSTCGCRHLLVLCSLTAKACCNKESIWTCRKQRHSYKLKLCLEGNPTACPGCQDDKVNAEIQAGFQRIPISANHEELFRNMGAVSSFHAQIHPYSIHPQATTDHSG